MTPSALPEEMLPIVDERDRVIGTAPRSQVHAQNLRHRAVHLLLFDPQGRVYLQRRSANKDTFPLMWAASASGHVDPHESYDQAVVRETQEELGLLVKPTPLGAIDACQTTGNEFTRAYVVRSHDVPQPNPDEIIQGRFLVWQEALDLAADLGRSSPSLALVLALYDPLSPA